MRNLATIQELTDIQPIEGKDLIGLGFLLGWQVIISKKDFNIGDKVVYVECDSVLPEKEEFEFLRKKNFRIRTMKLGGVISQGICFPLSILPAGNYKVGQDVGEIIGVTKYDPEADTELLLKNRCGKDNKQNKLTKALLRFKWFRKLYLRSHKHGKNSFPVWIKKTDETRLQNIPSVLRNNDRFIVTEKLDGASGTYALKRTKFLWKEKFEFVVCSRNLRLPEDNSNYWRIAKQYDIENVLKKLLGNANTIVLQGEILGSNIQGNKYKLESGKLDFYAFNIYIDGNRAYGHYVKNCLNPFGINSVPVIDAEFDLLKTVQEMVDYSNGKSMLVDELREGIVVRDHHGKVSFKVISPEFLLKHGL